MGNFLFLLLLGVRATLGVGVRCLVSLLVGGVVGLCPWVFGVAGIAYAGQERFFVSFYILHVFPKLCFYLCVLSR